MTPEARVKKVLIVDDEHDVRLMLRSMFATQGWEVHEAASGDEALERDPATFDAIVLDQRMPGANGDEVGLEFRRRGYGGPIVFFSAYISGDLEDRLVNEVNADLRIVSKTDFPRLREVVGVLTATA